MAKGVRIVLGILVIIILIVIIVSFIANLIFNHKVKKEVKELFDGNPVDNDEIVQKSDLVGLPDCVQKWLEYSKVVGKERIKTVRLKQNATMRLKEDQSWMPVKAEQYFTVNKPGFIWKAKIKAAPLFHIAGRDKYFNGKGNMSIKLLSLIPVADGKGEEMDQGTMVRYLAESVWFPTAALSDYIEWEEIDSNSAKATMTYEGVTASGVFKFNDKGEVINFVAERYGDFDGEYVMETWSVLMNEYKEFNGVMAPSKGEVIWKLKTGDFNWFQFEITEIEYNNPASY